MRGVLVAQERGRSKDGRANLSGKEMRLLILSSILYTRRAYTNPSSLWLDLARDFDEMKLDSSCNCIAETLLLRLLLP